MEPACGATSPAILSSLACNGSVGVAGGLRHDGLVSFVRFVCRAKPERERERYVCSRTIFFFWKRPGGRLLPYFCPEKRPVYVADAPGVLFQNCFMVRPGGRLLRSLRYAPCIRFILRAPCAPLHTTYHFWHLLVWLFLLCFLFLYCFLPLKGFMLSLERRCSHDFFLFSRPHTGLATVYTLLGMVEA